MTAGGISWNFRQDHAKLPRAPLLCLYRGREGDNLEGQKTDLFAIECDGMQL